MTRRPVIVTTGRHPFEIAVLVASAMCGLTLILAGVSPRSVAAAMPGLIQQTWQVFLAGGGIIGLVGVVWPGRLAVRLGTEAIGMVLLATATTMYSVALFVVSGQQALAAGAFVAAIGAASWARLAQIARDARRAYAAEQRGDIADVPLLVEEHEP